MADEDADFIDHRLAQLGVKAATSFFWTVVPFVSSSTWSSCVKKSPREAPNLASPRPPRDPAPRVVR